MYGIHAYKWILVIQKVDKEICIILIDNFGIYEVSNLAHIFEGYIFSLTIYIYSCIENKIS